MSHNILKDLENFKKMAENLGDLSTLGARVANEVINSKDLDDETKSKLRKIDYNSLVKSGMSLTELQNEIKRQV